MFSSFSGSFKFGRRRTPPAGLARLFSMGPNNTGLTGLGTTAGNAVVPTQVGELTGWDLVSARNQFSLGIINGELYTWGPNSNNRTGLDTDTGNTLVPTRVGEFADWTTAVSAETHGHAIRNGELWAWGRNGSHRAGLDVIDEIYPTPTRVGTDTGWTHVDSRFDFSLGIRNGELWVWGNNTRFKTGRDTDDGQTQTPTQLGTDTGWTWASAGATHGLGIRDGKLYSWGDNNNGRTGLGIDTNTNTPTPTQVGSDDDWTMVSAGSAHCLGIRNGELYSWGSNANGRTGLGIGTFTNTLTPERVGELTGWTWVSAGSGHSLGIRNGELYSWGEGQFGRTGLGTDIITNTLTPTRVGTDTGWVMAEGGNIHSLCIR